MDWELIKSQDDDNSYFKLVDFPVEILFYVISYLPTRDHDTNALICLSEVAPNYRNSFIMEGVLLVRLGTSPCVRCD